MSLKEYNRKRKFDQTAEPPGAMGQAADELRFVIQMHDASRLHFDFRIEMDGVFKSWAVPKGPSLNPNDQRLAVFVEDHPIEYGGFEGIIPKGNYGAGTVMIWDAGTFHERTSSNTQESIKKLLAGLEKGHITIVVSGRKIGGEFAFIKLKDSSDPKAWLLVKKRDEFASYSVNVLEQNRSVASGRTIKEIAAAAADNNAVWLPGKGAKDPKTLNKLLYFTGERLLPFSERKTNAPVNVAVSAVDRIEDAGLERLPRKNKPMQPQFGGKIFSDPDWIFELDHGGHRALAELEHKRVSLYSKQGLDYRKKYPNIVSALAKLNLNAVLDGDIVSPEKGNPVYYLSDILHLDGRNLRELPFELRQKILCDLGIYNDTILPVETAQGDPKELLDLADKNGCSSLTAKHRKSPYLAGTHSCWLKIDLEKNNQSPEPIITHPDKIYWPKEHITKGDVIAYYDSIADIILPHLIDRPQSLNRHPNGIEGESFFQKDMVGYLPSFVSTHKVFSRAAEKSINYLLCQNKKTLIYLANLGCIELNPWLSRIDNLEHPDFSVIDLDPDDNPFEDVIKVALAVKAVLDEVGALGFVKTSGSTGIHILIPTGAVYSYDINRSFAEEVCRIVNKQLPKLTSIERSPSRRRGRIYLDFMQNRRGQTLAAPYCLRPKPGATASAPLLWQELQPGLTPALFTIKNLAERVRSQGDHWAEILTKTVDIEPLIEKVRLLPL